MQYHKIDLQEYIQKSNIKEPTQEELQDFTNNLATLLETKENESEEHQKNRFRDFLTKTFKYDCNTKGRIDLAIYNGENIEVIIEFKALNNIQEFPKDSNTLQSKALVETILYYLRESKTNNNIKYIIIANIKEIFIIEAKEYEKVFKDNKALQKAYKNCDQKDGTDTSTQKFYNTLKDYLPTLNSTLKFTHFNIETTPPALLYQILSPQSLLKQKNYIDANTLNQSFYDELLYILGLQEINKNSKVLIQANNAENTLLDSICRAFTLHRDKDFEIIFSLLTTWNNRILFLRLLESMLLSFKHIKTPFLDINILKDFKHLNTLFFEVLAIKEDKRKDTPKELDSIPYLNSSLFDKTKLEKEGKEIKLLDSKQITIFNRSILKKAKDYKDTESLPLLEYLFAFLHAYDFTTTPKDIIDNIKTNHDKLINSAVLGLVFEKLNGYKEGSFYTPSFITSYMCKESLEKVVIKKFNEAFSANAKTINELPKIARDENKTIQDLRTILFSIKICDPAVGSGHFLVSALNELVFIAHRLGILESLDFYTTLELDNEEIIIKKQGKILEYTKPNDKDEPQHKIQQELFNLKKEIIESCLFGVDINPNSCEITKLRLWIELLKYSFYIFDSNGNTNTLETLPNIDINIKCGNSLISRFDLQDSLKHISNITHQIKRYKKLVFDYKNADQNILNISKQEIEKQIETIKQTFTLTLKDPKTKNALEKAIETHIKNYGISLLDDESLLDGLYFARNIFGNPQLNKEQEEQAYISYGKIVALRKKLDSTTSGEGYKNAFEWRFAFPEVLDKNGDFLGFDLVIGNPPYIDYRKIDTQTKLFLNKKSKIYKTNKEGSIFVYFIEKAKALIHSNGYCCFINPIAYICVDSGKGIRDFIDNNLTLLSMIDVSNFKVFNSASTYTCINHFSHKNTNINTINFGRANDENSLDSMEFKKLPQVQIENLSVQLDTIAFRISNIQHIKLSNCCDIFCGLSVTGFRANVSYNHRQDSNPFLESSDIHRYSFNGGKYIDNTQTYYSEDKRKIFEDSEIIFMARMTNFIRCCIASKGYYGGKVNILHNFKVDKRFLLGILNSKLMSYFYSKKYFASHMQGGAFGFDTISVGKLPIPKITESNKPLCNEIIKCVEQILESRAKDSALDTSKLESKINSLVYQLYNLTDDEIKIIESKT